MARAAIAASAAATLTARAFDRQDMPAGRVRLVSAGKASRAMARAAMERLGARIAAGIVIGPSPGHLPAPIRSVVGGHPVPTPESIAGGRLALDMAAATEAGETLLVLLSGGASALMAVPAEGLTLDDKQSATNTLLRAGADIRSLNTVRKHLSAVKGGRLAGATRGRVVAYAISDVVGDDLSVIASGPTVPDATTYSDALNVLRAYGGEGRYPPSVVRHLVRGAAGAIPETPKPGDPRLARAETSVIGSGRDALDGAAGEARLLGYHVLAMSDPVIGEARVAAHEYLSTVAERTRHQPRPLCVVSGGETTVSVTGRGKGGRNQEFALAVAGAVGAAGDVQLDGDFVLASFGTDGVDGPTDAAGALVDSTTRDRGRTAGLEPIDRYLASNNSHAFFAAIGDLINTGPTGTNVGDVQILLLA